MYEAFYKLHAKPFSLSPDPHFLFASQGHRRAMSYLEYGVRQGEGFLVVTGEVGAGKTTLVASLFDRLPAAEVVAAQLVSTRLDEEDTLRMVAAAFGLDPAEGGKAALLRRIEEFLRARASEGKRVLLVVDEVQNLPPGALEELRMLSNFQARHRSLLQTFLVGQPEFRLTMREPGMTQLRQRVIAAYHLGPLDRDETRGYIEHRLATAGWAGDPAFDDAAVDAIFAFSDGIPRRINTLCDRLMLMGALEERHAFGAREVAEVVHDIRGEMLHPGETGVAAR